MCVYLFVATENYYKHNLRTILIEQGFLVLKYYTLRPPLKNETPLLDPFFLHSHINQYGRLFTSGPSKTFPLLVSIREVTCMA